MPDPADERETPVDELTTDEAIDEAVAEQNRVYEEGEPLRPGWPANRGMEWRPTGPPGPRGEPGPAGTVGRADLLKLLLASALGAIVTGLGAYVTIGQNVVHQDDLQAAIERNSPYVRDREAITRELDTQAKYLAELRSEVNYLRDYTNSLTTQITLLNHEITELQKALKRR